MLFFLCQFNIILAKRYSNSNLFCLLEEVCSAVVPLEGRGEWALQAPQGQVSRILARPTIYGAKVKQPFRQGFRRAGEGKVSKMGGYFDF